MNGGKKWKGKEKVERKWEGGKGRKKSWKEGRREEREPNERMGGKMVKTNKG